MKYQWDLPAQQEIVTDVVPREVVHVLVEYDGPQLILLQAGAEYFLGLAADYDEQVDRWVHAPITSLELEALARGGIAMREVFVSKVSIDIVDYDLDGNPRGMWPISARSIPKGILPVKGAPLPKFAQNALVKAFFPGGLHDPEISLFRLVGRPVYDHAISFAGLGTVVLSLQRLWSAISSTLETEPRDARGTLPPPQTLLFGAMVRGSFGVELAVVDREVFSKIAAEYTRLMRGSFQDDFEEFLRNESPMVLAAYRDYLTGLKRLQIDVMAEFAHAPPVFMGHACAERVATSPSLRRHTSQGSPKGRTTVLTRQGYFERFGLNDRRFEFYDNVDAKTLRGKVSRALVHEMRERRRRVAVGPGSLYDVDLKTSAGTDPSKSDYELVEYREVRLL